MASPATGLLFRILFICLAFDIARRFFEKPVKRPLAKNKHSPETKKDKYEDPLKNKEINTALDDEDDDNDFGEEKKPKKSKKTKKNKKNKKKSVEEEEDDDEEEEENKEILTIIYDKKSYQKYFTTLKNELMGNFTSLDINEKEYPLPANKKLFSKVTFFTQMGVSIVIFSAQKFKNSFAFIPPNVFDMIDKNKWFVMIGNFLLHQWLNKFLSTTGAFEINYKGRQLFSKLISKRLPKEGDVHAQLKKLFKKKGKKKRKNVDNDEDDDE